MEQFLLSATKFKNISDFIDSKFQYYLLSKADKNSILYYVKNFIDNFIKGLKETHKAYYKLVEIDAGISYYNNKPYYSFDLKNLKEIRIHLEDIINDIILFYYIEEENNNSFCSKHLKYATINMKLLKNHKKLQLNKKLTENDIIEGKRIASKIIINYFHEVAGHVKFGFSNSEYIDSPNKCISDKNVVQTLVPNDFPLEYKNVIRILNENEKSDSGSFFELIYGKAGEVYIKDLIDSIHNYWRIVDMPELFLEKLSLFSKYIKYRFIFEFYKLKDSFDLNSSIEEEIEYMKILFKQNNIDIEKIERNDKNKEEEINKQENAINSIQDNDNNNNEDEKEEEENGEISDDEEEEFDCDIELNDKHKRKKVSKFDTKDNRTHLFAIKKYKDYLTKFIKNHDKYSSENEKLSINSSLFNSKK